MHEWLFRLRFAQSRVAQLDLAPTLAVFASRSVISMPPRFAKDYSARATFAVFVETHRLRTLMPNVIRECPESYPYMLIRESRIVSSPRDKMFYTAHRLVSLFPSAAGGQYHCLYVIHV
jgi:hypothetical protein